MGIRGRYCWDVKVVMFGNFSANDGVTNGVEGRVVGPAAAPRDLVHLQADFSSLPYACSLMS